MDSGALNAERDAEIDGSPTWIRQTAIAAFVVARNRYQRIQRRRCGGIRLDHSTE